MEKISVIGGSGFIGTRLCQRLAARGADFEIIDLKAGRSFPDRTTIADIRDPAALDRAVTGNVLVHLAAVHRDDVGDPEAYRRTNVDGTRHIAELAGRRGIRRIVFTSSVAVYGDAAPGTGTDGEVAPTNPYGRTKAAAEAVLRAWHATAGQGASLVILRPVVVFGEGNRGNVFNLLSQIASGRFLMVGAGRNRKSMAYVGNLAAYLDHLLQAAPGYALCNYADRPDMDMASLVALVRAQLRGKSGYGPRLPYAAGMALGHLADTLATVTGKRMAISAARVAKFCAETSFAPTPLPGFTPPFTLEEGLERTLEAEFLKPDAGREIFFTE